MVQSGKIAMSVCKGGEANTMTARQVTQAGHSLGGDPVDGGDTPGGDQLHPTRPLFPSAGGQYDAGTPDYHGQWALLSIKDHNDD